MQLFRNRDQQFENAITQIHTFELLNQDPGPQDNDDEEDILDRPMNNDQFQPAQSAMKALQNDGFRLITTHVHE